GKIQSGSRSILIHSQVFGHGVRYESAVRPAVDKEISFKFFIDVAWNQEEAAEKPNGNYGSSLWGCLRQHDLVAGIVDRYDEIPEKRRREDAIHYEIQQRVAHRANWYVFDDDI